GCVRLNGGFALGVLWRLWRRRSLFRKSIRPPAATTTTRGVNIHSRWSTAVAGGGASAVGPGGGFSSQTTALRSPRCGDRTRSSAFFSLPHTYWSIVTASFAGSGAAPFRTTVPLMVTPDAAREAARPVTSITTAAPSTPARRNVIGADLTRRHRSTQVEKNFTSQLDKETMARCDVGPRSANSSGIYGRNRTTRRSRTAQPARFRRARRMTGGRLIDRLR